MDSYVDELFVVCGGGLKISKRFALLLLLLLLEDVVVLCGTSGLKIGSRPPESDDVLSLEETVVFEYCRLICLGK